MASISAKLSFGGSIDGGGPKRQFSPGFRRAPIRVGLKVNKTKTLVGEIPGEWKDAINRTGTLYEVVPDIISSTRKVITSQAIKNRRKLLCHVHVLPKVQKLVYTNALRRQRDKWTCFED